MTDPRYVEYVRTNLSKYPVEALKQALARSGVAPADIEEAVRLATLPPSAPPAPAEAPPPPQPPLGLIATAFGVLSNPAEFFRAMPKTGGWGPPLGFLLTMVMGSLGLRLALAAARGLPFGLTFGGGLAVAAVLGLAGGVVVSLIAFGVAAAVAHVIWLLLGSRQPFETSGRCVAYMAALIPVQAVVQAVPGVGIWLAIPVSLYGFYLFVPASSEAHGIDKGKAAAVAGILGFLSAILMMNAAFAAGRLRRLVSLENFPASGRGNAAQMAALGQVLSQVARSRSGISTMDAAGSAGRPAAVDPAQAASLALRALSSAPRGQGGPAQMAALGSVLSQMSKNQAVKPVDPQAIQALLPETLMGLPRASMESGRQGFSQMQLAATKATYRSADGRAIVIDVIDAGAYGAMMGAFGALDMQQDDGRHVVRTVQYKGYRAIEDFNKDGSSAKFNVLVAQRFMVGATSRGVDIDALRSAVDSLNLDSLAGLAQ